MRRLIVTLSTAALLMTGCGGSGGGGNEEVVVEGGEYGYGVPDEIEGGIVSMRFVNTGKEPHEFALGRIDGGHTLEEAIRDMSANDGDVSYATDIGGVPLLSPGEEITITRKLEPGTYGLLCFFPSPDGKSHLELGMKRAFAVVGESEAALPAPDAVITATADGYEVPEIDAGRRTVELRNESGNEPSWYLASAARPGVMEENFEAWLEGGQNGPSPVTFYGAMQSFPPGTSIFVTLDLEEGRTYRLADDDGGLPPVEFTPR